MGNTYTLKMKNIIKPKNLILPSVMLISSLSMGTSLAGNPRHLEMTHSAGTVMIEAQAMRYAWKGLGAGTKNVSAKEATDMSGDYKYMFAPESMYMDMYMLMPMYNITKNFSTMLMLNYMVNSMPLTNNSGTCQSTMKSDGIADTQISFDYKFLDDYMAVGLELNIPTASIDEKSSMKMGPSCAEREIPGPYSMQLGSGTYDLTPSIAYLGAYYTLRYGAQVSYKYRIGENSANYTFGNIAKTKFWIRKPFLSMLWSAELDLIHWGDINGKDSRIVTKMGGNNTAPPAFPENYGGKRVDFTISTDIPISSVVLGFDITLPVYQDLNGIQLKTSWIGYFSISTMF